MAVTTKNKSLFMKILNQLLVLGSMFFLAQSAKAQDEPTRYEVNPEVLLNTKMFDFSPTIVGNDNNTIIFSSSRGLVDGGLIDEGTGEPYQDLFIATRDKKGKWSEPVPMKGEAINSEHSEGSSSFSKVKKTLYFTRCPNESKNILGCDIWCTVQNNDGSWANAIKIPLKPERGIQFDVKDPAISPDGQRMVFSSNMDINGQESSGNADLWIVNYDSRTKAWGVAKNLGSVINTEGDEVRPTISDDGTLYFSSNGLKGQEGYDIYSTESWKDGRVGEVTNLKAPINSSADDYDLIHTSPNSGYFVSNRRGGKGQDDIYNFREPPVLFSLQVMVYDKATRKPLPNTKILLIGSDDTDVAVSTDENGAFNFENSRDGRYIKASTEYQIKIEGENYIIVEDSISTKGNEEPVLFIKEFYLERKNK
jgi:peptidoglycan-associated lipoprotein